MSAPEPSPIRPAATVVVLRPGRREADAFEVLMVRRNRSIAFMGGAYVFPGGRVDDGDAVNATDETLGVAALEWAGTLCRTAAGHRGGVSGGGHP